ncbi:MAG: glycoside hydrolase family 92 protein, partial [Bacteroidaceae bacterium]|nr:glycoside hydrolase family 92 protein [Bacteroidaceae bacterium]
MKRTAIFFLAACTAMSIVATDYTKYVNPFIGTQTDDTGALSGSTFPGPTMPQGMVQLAPETEQYVTWDPCCGYDFNRDSIFGFTHTHLSGTGCTDLIDISLMPTTKHVTPELLRKGIFALPFKHAQESAAPGYYMVDLLGGENIKAELSATIHVGIHKYTFPDGMAQNVILDLDRMTWRGDAYYTGRRSYQIIQSQIRVLD